LLIDNPYWLALVASVCAALIALLGAAWLVRRLIRKSREARHPHSSAGKQEFPKTFDGHASCEAATSVDTQTLHCQNCRLSLDVESVIAHCKPYLFGCFRFECPKCRYPALVDLRDHQISIGNVDGFPGPSFIPEETIEVPGLEVRRLSHPRRIAVKFRDGKWKYPFEAQA